MTNTRVSYMYRDASNNKAHRAEIVSGVITMEQVDSFITEREDDMLFFLPGQVGLPWAQQEFIDKSNNPDLDYDYHFPNDNDHVWCVLEGMEPTEDKPTLNMTAINLLDRFQKVRWDDIAAMKELGFEMDPLGRPF